MSLIITATLTAIQFFYSIQSICLMVIHERNLMEQHSVHSTQTQ